MPRLLATLPLLVLAACAGAAPPVQSASLSEPVAVAMPASPLDMRIEQLVPVLNTDAKPESYFAPSVLTILPAEKLSEVFSGFIATHGKALRVTDVKKTGPNSATLQIAYEKAVGSFDLYIDPAQPHMATGLQAKGFTLSGDNLAKIEAEFAALSGASGYVVQQLGDDGSFKTLAGRNADTQFAIGSTFKLYILAELASQVVADTREWTDVAPLAHRSFSSLGTNNWPKDSPATLHSLATWMISVSDNSATDTLLFLLGREAVEQKLAIIGHGDPNRTLPFLSTVEAFTLKAAGNADVRNRFLTANEAQQRALLSTEADKLTYDKIDSASFTTGPMHIDTLEWFASPTDVVRVFDNIRRTTSKHALDIMAVNPGLPPSSAAKWKYVGYKGGSEPGVISMSYLLQSPSGKWLVVSGSWNDAKVAVDNGKFGLLMTRLADQFAE